MQKDWHYIVAPAVTPGSWVRARALRLLIGGCALTVALIAFGQMSPQSWWSQSGLSAYPGNFVARRPVDYPVCAPWTKMTADILRRDWRIVEATTSKPITGGDQANLGFLLPKTAKIVKIYCATGAAECSWEHCNPPLTFLAVDANYTRNRAINLSLINKAATHAAPTDVHVWLLWQ